MGEIKFNIVEHIGKLSDEKAAIELNLVEWGNRKAVYDLRHWRTEDGEKVPLKGITLSADELKALRDILNSMETHE